jgi:hypothetical protein
VHPTTNEPYIAYPDGAANAFVVKKYNGTAWVQVGTNQGFASYLACPVIRFNPTTSEPYIAYPDGASNAFAVKKFDGTNWIQIGSNQGFASGESGIALAFNPASNEPYITYPDGAVNAFVVKRFTAGSWTQVGTNQGFASNATAANIAFNAANEPYIAFPDAASNAFVVKKFTSGAWLQVGTNLGFASSDSWISIAFNKVANEPYVAYPDGAADAFAVKKFTNNSWAQVGTSQGFASSPASISIAFNPINNELLIAYNDGAANSFVVKKDASTITLPVTFVSFNANCSNSGVELKWATSSEINSDHFVVEYSADGSSFTGIATIAGKGNSSRINNYSYVDKIKSSKAFYRIKQVDADGKANYTPTVIATCYDLSNPSVNVYPNPTAGKVVIKGLNKEAVVSVINAAGTTVSIKKITAADAPAIDISNQPTGVYTIRIETESKVWTRNIVVTK